MRISSTNARKDRRMIRRDQRMRFSWSRTKRLSKGKIARRSASPPAPNAAKLIPVPHTRQYLLKRAVCCLVDCFVECVISCLPDRLFNQSWRLQRQQRPLATRANSVSRRRKKRRTSSPAGTVEIFSVAPSWSAADQDSEMCSPVLLPELLSVVACSSQAQA